jgi:hypothetical protein
MMKLIRAGVVLFAAGSFATPSVAHHGPAAFDQSKEIVIEGKLTRFAVNNPHTYLTLEIIGSDGAATLQDVEAGPISTVQPLGLERDSLRVGERVVVRGNPSRRGAGHSVLGLYVTRADGQVFPLSVSSARTRPPSTARASSIAGTWHPTFASFAALNDAIASWPLTDAGRQRLLDARRDGFTTHSDCIPAGAPMLMVYPVATIVSVDATTVVFDIDWIGTERAVRLDAEHSPDLEPTLQGHSIGRWEGDVLVVDTRGFTAHAEGIGFAMPSSEQKHLIERFGLAEDRRHLVYDVTIEDPVYLAEPVRYTAQWEYAPDLVPSRVACDLEIARRYLREAAQQ